MRFSVLEFRSGIRIALQAPVVKIEKVVRNKINIYYIEWGMEPPTTNEYEKKCIYNYEMQRQSMLDD